MSWGSADLVPTSWPLRSESALGSVVPLPCPPPRLIRLMDCFRGAAFPTEAGQFRIYSLTSRSSVNDLLSF